MAENFNSLSRLKELIQLVEGAPDLYDFNRMGYRDLNMKRKFWLQIAATMGLTASECKEEWEKIREKYTKQHKRIRAERSGTSASIVDNLRQKWPVFDLLQFLEPYVQARRNHASNEDQPNNMSSIHDLDNDDLDYRGVRSSCNESGTNYYSAEIEPFMPTNSLESLKRAGDSSPERKRTKQDHASQRTKPIAGIVRCQRQQPTATNINNMDDDSYHFAMTLLPTLRSLSEEQRSTAKLKIMELLHEIKYEK